HLRELRPPPCGCHCIRPPPRAAVREPRSASHCASPVSAAALQSPCFRSPSGRPPALPAGGPSPTCPGAAPGPRGTSAMSSGPVTTQRTFLGHPVGLYILFLTEMWERFNYYGMRALLMLYMVNYFRWEQGQASTIYKWYSSLVYLTPLLGGYL